MKSDLSKVTFTASILQEIYGNECEIGIIPHSRRVTLLMQAHKMPSSSGGTMSKLTFTNVFDHHSPEEIEKLDNVYAECHGKIPSRRQLSAIAQAVNIQQSKIRKWFQKRALEEAKQSTGKKDTFWSDLSNQMDKIDDRIRTLQMNNNLNNL